MKKKKNEMRNKNKKIEKGTGTLQRAMKEMMKLQISHERCEMYC